MRGIKPPAIELVEKEDEAGDDQESEREESEVQDDASHGRFHSRNLLRFDARQIEPVNGGDRLLDIGAFRRGDHNAVPANRNRREAIERREENARGQAGKEKRDERAIRFHKVSMMRS